MSFYWPYPYQVTIVKWQHEKYIGNFALNQISFIMKKVPTDKMLHFIVSFLLAIVASTIIANAIYNIMPDNPSARTATAYGAALFVTLAIGVWKESRDRKQAGNHFCWKDLAADAVGAGLGSLGAFVSYLI